MSVNNTGKTPFFKRVGNWFNKNGNTAGKIMTITGTTAMGVGMTGMFIHEMKHPSHSIFGGGFGYCNPMCNPMMGSMGMFGGIGYPMMGSMGMFGGMGNFHSIMGQQMAYQYGMQQRMMTDQTSNLYNNPNQFGMYNQYNQFGSNNQFFQPTYDTTTTTTTTTTEKDTWKDNIKELKYKANEYKSKDGDEADGKNLDTQTDKLGRGTIKNIELTDDKNKLKETYQQKGKDQVAYLDSDKDGFVDIEEFTDKEKGKSKFNKTIVTRAFEKIDLNGDNKLDYSELSSLYATFSSDYGASGEISEAGTNNITKENYDKWSEALGSSSNSKIVQRMQNFRQWLFEEN